MSLAAPVLNDQRVPRVICSCGDVINGVQSVDPNRKYYYLCRTCSRLSEDLMYHIFDRPTNVSDRLVLEVTYYVLFTGHNGTCRLTDGNIVTDRSVQTHQFYLSDRFTKFVTKDGKVSGGPLNLYRKTDDVCECRKSKRTFTIIDATVKEGFIILINHGKPIGMRKVTDRSQIKRLEQIDLCKKLRLGD